MSSKPPQTCHHDEWHGGLPSSLRPGLGECPKPGAQRNRDSSSGAARCSARSAHGTQACGGPACAPTPGPVVLLKNQAEGNQETVNLGLPANTSAAWVPAGLSYQTPVSSHALWSPSDNLCLFQELPLPPRFITQTRCLLENRAESRGRHAVRQETTRLPTSSAGLAECGSP